MKPWEAPETLGHGFYRDEATGDRIHYLKEHQNGDKTQIWADWQSMRWAVRANDIVSPGVAGEMTVVGYASDVEEAVDLMKDWVRDHPKGVNPGGGAADVFGFGGG